MARAHSDGHPGDGPPSPPNPRGTPGRLGRAQRLAYSPSDPRSSVKKRGAGLSQLMHCSASNQSPSSLIPSKPLSWDRSADWVPSTSSVHRS